MMDKYIQQFVAELKREGKSPATLFQYQKHLKLFGALTKIENLSKINSLTIRKFRIFLVDEKNKLLPSTQNYYLISLRAFLKFLKKNNLAKFDYKKVKLFKHQVNHRPKLEKEEAEEILTAPEKTGSHLLIKRRDKALLEVLYSTDLKVAEISNLTRDDFAYRKIKFSNQARFALKKYLEKRKDKEKSLFIRHDRAQKKTISHTPYAISSLTPRSIQRIVERYAKRIKINKKITPESFRHH